MAGFFPQAAIHDLRGVDLLVAALAQQLPDVVLDLDVNPPAPVVPEHHPRRFFLNVEQIERLADLAVVALLRFLQPMQVGFQRFLIGPGGAVDALEHLVARIAAPVRARHLHQLEGFELAGGRHVRAATQIDEIGLSVQRNRLLARDVGDDLRLVVLAQLAEKGDGFIARHDRTLHRNIPVRQFLHPRLNPLQIFRREGPLEGKVVIKAVFDYRADGDLGARIQLFDRVRQQMRAGMTEDLQAFRTALGDDGEIRVPVDEVRGIHQPVVHLGGQSGFQQSRPDGGGDIADADRRVERALAAVGKCNDRHCYNSLNLQVSPHKIIKGAPENPSFGRKARPL